MSSVFVLGARGPLAIAGIASVVLVFRSLGFRLMRVTALPLGRENWSRLGPFVITHSHHTRHERSHHEFQVGEKYFCAGCCGLASGTLVGVTLAVLMLLGGSPLPHAPAVILICLLCCFPTLGLVYAGAACGPRLRGLAYALLPAGAWVGLAILHATFENAWLNLVAVTAIVVVWHYGGVVYRRLRERRG